MTDHQRPLKLVGPSDLFVLLAPERWHAESLGYVDSAIQLFHSLSESDFTPNWPRAKAAAFLFGHGLELFLKSAIAQAGENFPWGHDLRALHNRYSALYPEPNFAFRNNLGGFIDAHEPLPYYDFLKYPERLAELGKTWNAGLQMEMGGWLHAVSHTRQEITRIWPLILETHPRDLARFQDHIDGEFERHPSTRGKRE